MESKSERIHSSDQCFYKIKNKSECREELLKFAHSITDWETDTKSAAGEGRVSTFLVKYVPNELIVNDSTLEKISSLLKIKFKPVIIKMERNTFHKLHIDAWRGAAINMLLNDNTSSKTFYDCGEFRPKQIYIEELHYESDFYYLLNTQIEHAVLNLESDRYMLTISLGKGINNRNIKDPNFYLLFKTILMNFGL